MQRSGLTMIRMKRVWWGGGEDSYVPLPGDVVDRLLELRWGRGYRDVYLHSCGAVSVSLWEEFPDGAPFSLWFRVDADEIRRLSEKPNVASKYLKVAVAARASAGELLGCEDPILFRDRPAIEEFMRMITDDEGKPRDVSVIMICPQAEGFRVGINDNALDAWLWRQETTVIKALNAIEKALQSGEATFTRSKSKTQQRGKGRG